MNGQVSSIERSAFRMAYEFYQRHCEPPANQDSNACDWWKEVANEAAPLYNDWQKCSLGQDLLLGVMHYLETKSKEKTQEINDFV